MKRFVRGLFESLLKARGYELKLINEPLRGFSGSLRYAKSRGLSPRTVFDVGVGHGTPWLYDAFPDSKLVLFEPLSVFDADIADIVRRHKADAHRVALAAEPGESTLNLNVGHPTSSSLFTMNTDFSAFADRVQNHHEFRPEPVTLETLDRLNQYEGPYVLKLDVEGAERGVLEGARRTLQDTQFLIMEMSVMRRVDGEASFAEMIEFVDDCGFELFDIPSLAQTHDTEQLIYLDAAFVPKNSSLWPS